MKPIRDVFREIRRRLRAIWALRMVVWAARLAKSGWGHCANRAKMDFEVGPLEVFIQLRDRREPDGYERTEVLRMLQKVRMAEAVQGWECPDPGPAKRGQLVYDGEAVDVFYVWDEPRIDDGPWTRAQTAREIVSVTAEGRRRVLCAPASVIPAGAKILTVLSPGHGYRLQEDRIACDGRWRRYIVVAENDHEWPGTEGGTIILESPDDPEVLSGRQQTRKQVNAGER